MWVKFSNLTLALPAFVEAGALPITDCSGRETLNNYEWSVCVVGFLSDVDVQGDVDDLLTSAATPSSNLMNRLISLGWRPDGEVPTLLYGLSLFVMFYNTHRDEGTDFPLCLDMAYAETINHPIFSRLIAARIGTAIDGAAGV